VSQPGRPVLLLFNPDTVDQQDPFITAFIVSRPAGTFVLPLQGQRIFSLEEFFDECEHAMPVVASYFGRNLDALDEILGDRGVSLSPDPTKPTYWIWGHADNLLARDLLWFNRLFTVLVSDAALTSGVRKVQVGPQPRTQPVFIIFTGTWERLAEHQARPDSFLYRLHYWYNPKYMADEDSGIEAIRVI